MVKTLCVVQARLTSTRLPNKVLMELGGTGMSIAEHVNQRLCASRLIDKVVFAIPDTPSNDPLAGYLAEHKIPYLRGNEDNVLERFYQVADRYQPEIVVRATYDNPFVDWEQLDALISNLPGNDYVSSLGAPLGTSAEVFFAKALYDTHINAKTEVEREHVTPYIYRHPELFKVAWVPYYLEVEKERYRLTVDTELDFEVADTIYRELYKGDPIRNSDIYIYLESHPQIRELNLDVIQKTI